MSIKQTIDIGDNTVRISTVTAIRLLPLVAGLVTLPWQVSIECGDRVYRDRYVSEEKARRAFEAKRSEWNNFLEA